MKRITKAIAAQMADAMTKEKRTEISKAWDELKAECLDILHRRTPKDVVELSKKHPEFFNFRTSISLGITFGYKSVGLDGSYIESSVSSHLPMSKGDVKKIGKLLSRHDDLNKEVNKLKLDLENTLYALKTYKRVTEAFQEAVPYLPVGAANMEVMIDIQSLVKRL